MSESFEINNPVAESSSLKVCKFDDASDFGMLSSYNHFTVILILQGCGKLIADTSEYVFEASCFMSFSLYQPFQICFQDSCEGYLLHFHPDFFCLHKHRSEVSCNGILFNNIYESPLTQVSGSVLSDLAAVTSGMISEMRRDIINTEILLSYLKILLISASRIKVEQRNTGMNADSKIPGKLVALQSTIEANFRSVHNAGAYADILHHSQSALNRACKEYFNKALSDLISDRIILEAKRELYLTDKPVKALAYDLGFTDEFHFSRYFKRNIGISPQHFRNTVGVGKATGT